MIRTVKPNANDKYYVRQKSGGYSTCVQGKPTDKECDVLANCVGYACGAYNEEHNFGYEKYHLNCNAENFIERAIASGLSVYKKPMAGGILVWQKGKSLSGKDGAGHVAMCTEVVDENTIKTAESGYGSKVFWTATRKNINGNWGQASSYKYRGCIAPLGYEPVPIPTPTPTPEPTPIKELKVGDKVKIIGTGKASSDGTGVTARGIGWTRYITKIYEGRPYPYQVGNEGKTDSANTTGFYKAEALEKL